MNFDPRLTPARPDLAAAHLRGKVTAARFAEGTVQEVVVGQTPVRQSPSHDTPLLTEALRGERVTVYEIDDEGWAWGQLLHDGYVGWLPAAAPRLAIAEFTPITAPVPSSSGPPELPGLMAASV